MKPIVLAAVACACALAAKLSPSASPDTVKPGDTFKYSVVIPEFPCTKAYFDGTNPNLNIQISGSGVALTADAPTVSACSLVVTMKADANAAYGDRVVTVLSSPDKDKKQDLLARFVLNVVATTAGPIPPGISPQVDVMWNLLSEPSCSDQFGLRIARRFYCIEVVLGNNSGYALLLSGVGFLHKVPGLDFRESNVSYLNVRSAAQREQVVSGRNITLRSLQAAGIVIAGFAPFPVNTIPRLRLTQWSTVMGTVLSGAWDGLVPDRTVLQSHNLDDASLRDGKLIANNSPVRFTIFVARDSIKGLLLPLPERMAYQASLYRESAVETRLSIGTGDADAAAKEENAKALEQLASALEAKVKAPESRTNVGAAGKKGKSFLGRRATQDEADLIQVRRALGSLILVGDTIEYKQRIRVDSSAVNPEVAPQPFIQGPPVVSPVVASGTANSPTVTINGANLSGAQITVQWQKTSEAPTTLAIKGTPEVDNIHVKFTFDLTKEQWVSGATLKFIVKTNGGSVTTSYTVP